MYDYTDFRCMLPEDQNQVTLGPVAQPQGELPASIHLQSSQTMPMSMYPNTTYRAQNSHYDLLHQPYMTAYSVLGEKMLKIPPHSSDSPKDKDRVEVNHGQIQGCADTKQKIQHTEKKSYRDHQTEKRGSPMLHESLAKQIKKTPDSEGNAAKRDDMPEQKVSPEK